MKLFQLALVGLAFVSMGLGLAGSAQADAITDSVNASTNTWVPFIISMVFLSIGLTVLLGVVAVFHHKLGA